MRLKSHNRVTGSSSMTSYGTNKLDLVFLFHTSDNIDDEGWERYKLFMNDVVSGANIDSGDVQVGAVVYNYQVAWTFPLNQYRTTSSLARAIDGLPLKTDRYANLGMGMDLVGSMFTDRGGDRPDVPNAVIVITDADANLNNERIAASAQKLKTESQARIYTAGIGLRGSSQLSSVASARSTVFSADSTGGLTEIKEDIVAQIPPCKRLHALNRLKYHNIGILHTHCFGVMELSYIFRYFLFLFKSCIYDAFCNQLRRTYSTSFHTNVFTPLS